MKTVLPKSSLFLFMTAFIWGVAFVAQSVGMDYMGPFSFNGARFLMGSLVLIPFIVYRRNKNKKNKELQSSKAGAIKPSFRMTLAGGICCGIILCIASLAQQIGIMYTTVGKAGFITTLYIIIVPVMGIFLKKKVQGKVWIAAGIAAFGMYLLCMSEKLALSKGDAWIFVCAVLFSVHIMIIDYFSPRADGVELSCIQFLIAGIICSIGAAAFEKPAFSDFMAGIVPLAYAGILSCGVAYTFQVIGQKDTPPAVASLILSLESVISVLAGWILLGQVLKAREMLGCMLVFAAVILVQLPEKSRAARLKPSEER